MKQYLSLLEDILEKGMVKEPARDNMPSTLSLFGTRMEFDMREGFPLLTTKKMYYKAIITELLWFLKGDTNIKYLVDNGCNIWNQDAYRWYIKHAAVNDCNANSIMRVNSDKTLSMFTFEEFVSQIKLGNITQTSDGKYNLGDLGKVYGHQWRNQNGIDQVAEVIEGLKSNPYSRYHIIDGWNKADFKDMALPPCHLLYQFNCRKLSDLDRKLMLAEKEEWKDQFAMIDEDPSGDVMEICDTERIPKYELDLQMCQRRICAAA